MTPYKVLENGLPAAIRESLATKARASEQVRARRAEQEPMYAAMRASLSTLPGMREALTRANKIKPPALPVWTPAVFPKREGLKDISVAFRPFETGRTPDDTGGVNMITGTNNDAAGSVSVSFQPGLGGSAWAQWAGGVVSPPLAIDHAGQALLMARLSYHWAYDWWSNLFRWSQGHAELRTSADQVNADGSLVPHGHLGGQTIAFFDWGSHTGGYSDSGGSDTWISDTVPMNEPGAIQYTVTIYCYGEATGVADIGTSYTGIGMDLTVDQFDAIPTAP